MHNCPKTFLKTVLIAMASLLSLLVLNAGPAAAITCAECKELDAKRRAYSDELEQKGQELKAAFEKKAYDKVTQINLRLTELRKQIAEMSGHSEECVKACSPDRIKAEECRAMKLEIHKLESESGHSDEQLKKVDELYQKLLRCNQELRRVLGKEE